MEQGAFNTTSLERQGVRRLGGEGRAAAHRAHEGRRLPRRQVDVGDERGGEDRPRSARRAPRSSVAALFLAARRDRHVRQRAPGRALGRRRPAGRATSRSTSALLICIAALVNLARALRHDAASDERAFVERRPAEAGARGAGARPRSTSRRSAGSASTSPRRCSSRFFMRWLGKYAWWKVAAVSIGDDGGVLPHLRDLVQGAAAQGPARSACSGWTERDGRDPVARCTASASR